MHFLSENNFFEFVLDVLSGIEVMESMGSNIKSNIDDDNVDNTDDDNMVDNKRDEQN